MKEIEEKQYREELLEWCNNIHYHWERMKPRFSKLFDLKSVEEWEETCLGLKQKLESDIIVDDDEYRTAENLYEQWELLYNESINDREETTSDEKEMVELSSDSDIEIELADRESETIEDDLIQLTFNLEIPRQEFRRILSDYKTMISQPK
ncbi:hypothetical protein [Bacillus sp. JJ1562]|uniref:hypothetical protein n=1 Tax=Bacillus sp. JJ1562 TaxID=3122960 RepID=UPI0030035ECC